MEKEKSNAVKSLIMQGVGVLDAVAGTITNSIPLLVLFHTTLRKSYPSIWPLHYPSGVSKKIGIGF